MTGLASSVERGYARNLTSSEFTETQAHFPTVFKRYSGQPLAEWRESVAPSDWTDFTMMPSWLRLQPARYG